MANKKYENQKVELRFSKKSIDKAARNIRHGCVDADRDESIEKIQNFRELHMYPLMLMKNHLARTSNKINSSIIVARRLKRLPTIINKLERPTLDGVQDNAIKLTRMQDIGGCRAIVKNLRDLNLLHNKLKESRSVHRVIHTANYLIPKSSGYSGIHLIYSCFHHDELDNNWKKTKIEVQLRTDLQHAWATSLEIIDTFEKIDLKTSLTGHDDWRRFFYLAGQLVAYKETAIEVDNDTLLLYRKELSDLNDKLSVETNLLRYSLAIKATTEKYSEYSVSRKMDMCLVTLVESKAKKFLDKKLALFFDVKAFGVDQAHEALSALNESEKDKDVILSVLLSSPDARSLKKAYPNYFGSTNGFTKFIGKQIALI
ncbi:RelA/SpoT domain-containing protein [Moritella sp. 28]|uniref:RelA/SpoT domain-containing protein n=1 Tax=Moritella sp. 28 TaxID=2746232 RepID=UPI001BAE0162|nr:RelA/SpoT domain-containing protein [Moritella sp. 28]QUM86324.1 RelA/SpoT domain-containing protein [Moritella sp. 28]